MSLRLIARGGNKIVAQEISWEIRERAEELYIVDGKTFEEVSEITGVSSTQLKRWGAGKESEGEDAGIPSWSARKREYRSAFTSIKRDTVLLRKRLIANALHSLEPQDVYAVSRMEALAAKTIKDIPGTAANPIEKKEIKTPQDAVSALSDMVEKKINSMLTQPDAINLNSIKEMKQTLELIEKMKSKYTPEVENEQSSKGLSDEVAKTIQDKILGI